MKKFNFHSVTNQLANGITAITKSIQKLISETLRKNQEEHLAQKQNYRQAIIYQAGLDTMNHIQPEMAGILGQAHFTNRLCPINHVGDFLPYEYKIMPDNSLRFFFLWTKTNSEDNFDSFILDSIVHNMNLAIINYVNRYILIFQRLNDYEKREFYCQHPSFNFGFKVLSAKNIQDSIVIEMELGFPE